jgi:MFS family permease
MRVGIGADNRPRVPRLAGPMAFWIAATILVLLPIASTAPSLLYMVYQAQWHFSTETLTTIFAVYALAVIVTLILFGSLSDRVGRRPVLVIGLLGLVIGMALFIAARGVAWLLAARVIHGLAVGFMVGTLNAAIMDLEPPTNLGLGIRINTIAPNLGLAMGALATAFLVQYGPAPTTFIFVLLLVAFTLALVAVVAMPESVAAPSNAWRRYALRPSRVTVPVRLRGPFAVVSMSFVAQWAIIGIYLSLGPSMVARVLDTSTYWLGSIVLEGLVIFVVIGVGSVVPLVCDRVGDREAMILGSLAMIGGFWIVVFALSRSVALFMVGSVIVGFGYGIAWMGSFRLISALAPPRHRAEVVTSVYVVSYLAFSLPSIAAGMLVARMGLTNTAMTFGIFVTVLAAVSAAGAVFYARPPAQARASPPSGP